MINKFKIRTMKATKIIFMVLAAILLILFNRNIAFGAVGQTLSQMTQIVGTPKGISLNYAVSQNHLAAYQKIGVSAYVFKVNEMKLYAVFNSSGVCYKEYTMNERTLPTISLMIGSALAGTKPKVLMRIPLRMEKVQYGTGANAVIYSTFGTPGNLSSKAYNPSLAPGLK